MSRAMMNIFIATTLSLYAGTAFAAASKCEFDRSKDKDKGFLVAKDAKGKTRKGLYIDKFTNQLMAVTTD